MGSTLKIHANALYTMQAGELEIREGGKLIIGVGGEMEYSGGDIFLNGPNAVFELGGIVKVTGANKFLLKNEDDNLDAGYLHIKNSGYPEWHFEAIGPNNEIQIEGSGEDNLILKIDPGAEFSPNSGTGIDIFRTKRIRRGKVEMGNDSRIQLFASSSNVMSNLHIDSEPGSRGVHVYRNNFFNNCEFDGGDLTALMFYYNEDLRVVNSEFNHTDIVVKGGSFDITGTEFDDAYFTSSEIVNPSNITKSEFINGTYYDSQLNGSTIKFENCNLIGGTGFNDNNMIYNQGGIFELRCNNFHDYEIEVTETNLKLNTGTLNGYNNFSGDDGRYISLDESSSSLFLTNGYNTFESSEPNAHIIYRVPNGYFGNVIIKAQHNFWKKYSIPFASYFDEGMVPIRFDFEIDPPSITPSENGTFSLTDPYTDVQSTCGEHDPNVVKSLTGNQLGPKDVTFIKDFNPFQEGMVKNVLTDPVLNTTLIDSLLLSEAIFLGINIMEFNDDSLGNDFLALDLFYDVLMYEYDTVTVEIDELLDVAFQSMKTTIEHTFLTDTITAEDNLSNFHPKVQNYVDVLMHRSDDVIADSNYVEQFYLEIDKAQMFNLIGKKKMAWQLLNNLDNCPLDSTEQDYLNQWLAGIGQEILYIDAGMENFDNDSLVGQVDSTLFNTPSPLEADAFYFGSQILGVDLVTYANCGLITFKKFENTSDRNFFVYPNPTSDILTLAFEQEKDIKLTFSLYNQSGKELLSRNLNGSQGLMQMDIGHLSSATYLYVISDGKEVLESGQVVKE